MIRSKHMLSLVVLLAGSTLNAADEAQSPTLRDRINSYKKELVALGAVIIGAVVWKTYRPSMRPSEAKASTGKDLTASGSSDAPGQVRGGGSTAEANSGAAQQLQDFRQHSSTRPPAGSPALSVVSVEDLYKNQTGFIAS